MWLRQHLEWTPLTNFPCALSSPRPGLLLCVIGAAHAAAGCHKAQEDCSHCDGLIDSGGLHSCACPPWMCLGLCHTVSCVNWLGPVCVPRQPMPVHGHLLHASLHGAGLCGACMLCLWPAFRAWRAACTLLQVSDPSGDACVVPLRWLYIAGTVASSHDVAAACPCRRGQRDVAHGFAAPALIAGAVWLPHACIRAGHHVWRPCVPMRPPSFFCVCVLLLTRPSDLWVWRGWGPSAHTPPASVCQDVVISRTFLHRD